MKVREINGARFYPVKSGNRTDWYPSVTTILSIINKPGLNFWRGKLGNREAEEISKEARELGTQVHAGCRRINEGGMPDDENPRVQELLISYFSWFRDAVEEVYLVETPVFSHRYRYAGTPDMVCRLRGDTCRTLMDIKTSKSIWEDMELQLAGYELAIREERPTPEYAGMRLIIVRLRKDDPSKPPEIKEYQNDTRAKEAFLYALGLHNFLRPGKPAELETENEPNGNN